ncbi:unnamed protein product [Arabis nemorensis]|uniref:Late embryogenesis abundant protein LEA-2 subgroup domain-containing protein n=1 Tax=Arabis nemorensis TaxID=586526 RepID=A0A565CEB6_9BRAS|nr:unnamed protein product [Arabis nemorensis]
MAKCNEDQAKPFAALSLATLSDQPNEDHYHHHDQTKHVHSRTKLVLCCGFIAALALLIAVTFIVLSLTVCHLRNPKLTVDSISFVQPLEFVNGQVNSNRNATVSVMISIRNPNWASFRMIDATVTNYYGQLVVAGGSVRRNETFPQKVRAKRTVKMNLTAEIVTTKLLESVPGLMEDLNGKGLDMRSSVAVSGKVKIMKIFKKSVYLKTDCSMKMMSNSSKITFLDMKCKKQHVHPI